ncbi:MAG: DUF1572 family protein [Roseivirga sp.]|nr:DUF1572 family protein [Roseivirga sp.]
MHQEITAQAIRYFTENTNKVTKCLEQLSEEEVWQRPNNASNAVGNQILHLCGNITQYAIASLGQNEDLRERDSEFAATGGLSKAQLLDKLSNTVNQAIHTFDTLKEEELLRVRSVQGFSYTGIAVIMHVVEHYSYHTGQIAFWTKLLKDKSLGFYDGIDLNAKNES